MDVHYNAFISYRHSPVDSKVAAEIQRQLEHFPIPGAIRKRTGVKRINRIFRDKEELPITSDLNEDITRALENADYLIVICSPRTEESTWVRREIETFLRTHSRKQVLTVLAEGEPEDTIPDLLRYDEVTDPETGEVHRVPVEPLSCDYRGSFRTARREELPRLAASLLGCGYDELRQRQRQYKTRRLTAILAGVLCLSLAFTAYFIRTSLVIQDSYRQLSESNQLLEESYRQVEENYQQVLRNQSEYLAAESQAALAEGDRLLAIQLALAALPSADNDRPVLPQAEYALSLAVGAYQAEEKITAAGSFTVEGAVKDYILNEDGTRLIVADDLDLVTVWDTDTYQRLMKLRTEVDGISQLFLIQDRYLIVGGGDNVQCFDLETGEGQWLFEGDYISGIAIAAGGAGILAANYDGEFHLLDTMTGELRFTVSVEGLRYVSCVEHQDRAQSPDGSLVAMVGACWVRNENGELLGDVKRPVIVDIDRGEAEVLPVAYYDISDLYFISDSELMIMGVQDTASSEYYPVYQTENLKTTVSRVSLDGEVQWTNEAARHRSYGYEKLLPWEGGDSWICVVGNLCRQIDATTGETLCEAAAESSVLDLRVAGGSVALTTVNGCYGTLDLETQTIRTSKLFVNSLSRIRFGGGSYLLQRGADRIIQYRAQQDEHFTELPEYTAETGLSYASNGDFIALLSEGDLGILDFASREFVLRMDLTELEDYKDSELLGLNDENIAFIQVEREECASVGYWLLAVDVTTGACTKESIPYNSSLFSPVFVDDVLYYTEYSSSEETHLVGWRAGEGEVFRIETPSEGYVEFCVSEEEKRAMVLDGSGAACLYDLSTGDSVALSGTVSRELPFTLSGDGSLAAAAGAETVYLWQSNGALQAEIPFEAAVIEELHFAPSGDQLLIVDENGGLYRYALDGTYLGGTDIHYDGLLLDNSVWQWQSDGSLSIRSDQTLSVIDTDDWREIFYVDDCIEYAPDSETLLCCFYDDGRYHIGYYQRYSTEELIAMGREYVATVELTAEQKAAYGLD